jgi:hypothetical protein
MALSRVSTERFNADNTHRWGRNYSLSYKRFFKEKDNRNFDSVDFKISNMKTW